MEALFRFLEADLYVLLFLVVGMAVGMGRGTRFPVGSAVCGVLLTVLGYIAMGLS